MSRLHLTNYRTVTNSQATTDAPPRGKIKSARIKWRGRSAYSPSTSSTNNIVQTQNAQTGWLGSFPALPAGKTFSHHSINIWWQGCSGAQGVHGSTGILSPFSFSWSPSGCGYVGGAAHYGGNFAGQSASGWVDIRHAGGTNMGYCDIYLNTHYFDDPVETKSRNMRVVSSGTTVTGPSSLNNGAESAWYDVPNVVGRTDIPLTHQVSGSGQVDYQLEITYVTILPTWVKVDGVWREVSEIYVKVDGAWKEATETGIKVSDWRSG